MKPMERMLDYFAGRSSAGEMKRKLGTGGKSQARELISLVEFDEFGRKLLSGLDPPPRAAERLNQRMVDVDTWVEQAEQARAASPSRKWLGRLTPEFDVVGHGLTPSQKPKRKKKPSKAAKSPTKKVAKSRTKAGKRSRKRPKRK